MINFHPDDNMLIEYASGSLETGHAIAIKAHLEMCTECQQKVSRLNALGAAFFTSGMSLDKSTATTDIQPETNASFQAIMAKIKANKTKTSKNEPAVLARNKRACGDLPTIVRRMVSNPSKIKWKRVCGTLKQANLKTGQDKFEICLHKIKRGGYVPKHDHAGQEVTVVLHGSFSDESGTYNRGDFIVKSPGQTHQPIATRDQDCLCLSVVEAPVKLTSLLGRLMNPWIPFHPA